MQAKAQALEEMIDSGVLTDYTAPSEGIAGDLGAELDKRRRINIMDRSKSNNRNQKNLR
jgi:hypothetical protein